MRSGKPRLQSNNLTAHAAIDLCQLVSLGPGWQGGDTNTEHRAHGIGSCLDLASPTRGRNLAAFTCSLSADAPCLRQEKRVIIIFFRWRQMAVQKCGVQSAKEPI